MNYRLTTKEMSPFEAFQLYNAVKLHFESKTYDAVKYNFKTSVKYNSFEKRRDKYFFAKLANKFNKKDDLIEYYVSNFVIENNWVGDMINETGERRYTSYLKFKQALSKHVADDIDTIHEHMMENGITFDDMFKSIEGFHPEVIKLMLKGCIRIETVVILDSLLGFMDRADKKVKDPMLWESIYRKVKKYSPFLRFDKQKIKNLCINKFVT